jgi:hypothetical protein
MHYKKKLTFEHTPSFLHQDIKGCVWVLMSQPKPRQKWMGTWFEISLGKGYTQTYSPLWKEMCGSVRRSPLKSQMHYHFCEFGVLRCCIILQLGLKDQTFLKLDYILIGLERFWKVNI